MTTAHVEKFAELVVKAPGLAAKLGLDKANTDAADSSQRAAFIANAVKEGKALGLEFTEEEATEFMVAGEKAAASGELSDMQLELIAGGKPEPVNPGMEGNPSRDGVFGRDGAINKEVSTWDMSWVVRW